MVHILDFIFGDPTRVSNHDHYPSDLQVLQSQSVKLNSSLPFWSRLRVEESRPLLVKHKSKLIDVVPFTHHPLAE